MHVIVVGGGISGLAAAHGLLAGRASVTVLEASARLGGKLLAGEIAGSVVDLGAESMLARRPEGVELAREVGLGEALEPPATASAAIWSRGEMCAMPTGHVMGVPGEPDALRGLLSEAGLARLAEDAELPPTEIGDDVAIGEYVAARMGREVVDRLVEPLLGGVYAGDAYRISMRAAVPQLYEAARGESSLLAGARKLLAQAPVRGPGSPVFMGIEGGIGRLPGAVADACRADGAQIRTGASVRTLRPLADDGGRWQVITEVGAALDADALVLALPAPQAARLLADEVPTAAGLLGAVEYASMALVTMAFRRADVERAALVGSGFLVPPVDGRRIKASTFSSNKWGWVAAQDRELFVLRTSLGRHGEEAVLDRSDSGLVELSLSDLRAAVGLSVRPVEQVVTRWNGGLPQYPVGHQQRMARVRDAVAKVPGLAVCGAAYEGVGIPACIASGQRAARETLARELPGSARE
jgi:protoporphyrinogen/coproporphyrinogen III oxidase